MSLKPQTYINTVSQMQGCFSIPRNIIQLNQMLAKQFVSLAVKLLEQLNLSPWVDHFIFDPDP